MRWYRRAASALVGVLLAALGSVGLAPKSIQAEIQYDALGSSALAIAAYEASRDQCLYSGKMRKALADIDAVLARLNADHWEEAKRTGPVGLIGLRNLGRMQGASDCKTYGLAIGYVAPVYFNAADLDQEVLAEFQNLLRGSGRSISGEAEARPPQTPQSPPPGSAAAIIAEMNRQNPTRNKSTDTGSGASTIQRLPPDAGPSAASRSQPPPRQSAEPSPQQGRTEPGRGDAAAPSKPFAQANPAIAPSATLPPTAPSPNSTLTSPGAGIPTSSAVEAVSCRAGSECRFVEATFACNLDDALALAEAGSVQGRQAGAAAVRAGKCEPVSVGRLLKLEATKSPNVVYATERGQHVGYLPSGVFAPADGAGMTPCQQPGFCAIRPGPPIWFCPEATDLDLPTPEAKRAAKCLQSSDSATGEVAEIKGSTAVMLNMYGGTPPYEPRYHVARGDLISLDLNPKPTPKWRGWCRPGDWCVTSVAALFCTDRAANERAMRLPPGEGRVAAIQAEPGCRILIPGNIMKPSGVPALDDPRRLIEVEHPTLKAGWASADAFKIVGYNPPIRYTSQLSDIVVADPRSPNLVAFAISAQGTGEASGSFRAGPKEGMAYCKRRWGEEDISALRICVDESNTTLTVKADCYAKRVSLHGRRYELRENSVGAQPDINPDPRRQWLYRDLASGEWLDGSSTSGEAMVGTAFNALCPGTDPEVHSSIAYRDPHAMFPRELQGRWFDNRRACTDPRRNEPDYDEHTWMAISTEGRVGSRDYEWPQRINAVRPISRGTWAIDGSHKIDDVTVPEIFQSSTYQLTRDGFVLRQQGRVSEWVRCR